MAAYVAAGPVYIAVGLDFTGSISASGHMGFGQADGGMVSLEFVGHDSVSGRDLCAGAYKELQPWNVGTGTELLLQFKKAELPKWRSWVRWTACS